MCRCFTRNALRKKKFGSNLLQFEMENWDNSRFEAETITKIVNYLRK